jgi:hypothetical protein
MAKIMPSFNYPLQSRIDDGLAGAPGVRASN